MVRPFMPVADRVQKLLTRIAPLGTELERALKHKSSIESRLDQAFGLVSLTITGSHERETAIRRASDVDYFAVLKRADARWGGSTISSDTFLQKVRDELDARFHATQVSRDRMAVVIHFDGGAGRVDVVPGVFDRFVGKHPVYRMPDGFGGWMDSSPTAYSTYLREANLRSQYKLSRVVQLLKFWKICRSPEVHLRSFHIEMLLAAADTCVGAKSYQNCLYDAFALIEKRQGMALQDPLGLSGNIAAAYSDAQRDQITTAAAYARDHAARAIYAEMDRNTPEAVRQWDLVFNGNFPA